MTPNDNFTKQNCTFIMNYYPHEYIQIHKGLKPSMSTETVVYLVNLTGLA